jgi:uncharacterized iron-regulated membrane protein
MRLLRSRYVLVATHRWLGVALALFLIIVAITGSLLAFNEELEVWLNPELFLAEPSPTAPKLLDPLLLREIVLKQYPNVQINAVWLTPKPGHSTIFSVSGIIDPITKKPMDLANDQIFVNSYSGEVLGERKWGDIKQGIKNLMPFIYRIHFALTLDDIGRVFLGIVALLWTFDSFVGLYLTFPVTRQNQKNKAFVVQMNTWFKRWKHSWNIRFDPSKFKFTFDLHRAGGLWLWSLIFVLAWSSVSFNLSEVYQPVMETFFDHQVNPRKLPKQNEVGSGSVINYIEAREIGRKLMAEQAAKHDFEIIKEDWMFYDSARKFYRYDVISSLDINEYNGNTRLFFDSESGEFKYIWLPTGLKNGDTVTTWLTSIHTAAMWGLPMKIVISLMGLVIAVLTVTGLMIWLKKRKAHHFAQRKKLGLLAN